ncbi:MAG: hypothetical protein DRN20_01260 [Thermoplasmata archaeon]|nr:MAG: hypothetical protein DRN20_01260 [Thermoplasmata archaeon]
MNEHDLNKYDLKTPLAMALGAERESVALYESLRKRTRNYVLRERLRFFADEERKHEGILRTRIIKLFNDQLSPIEPLETHLEDGAKDYLKIATCTGNDACRAVGAC